MSRPAQANAPCRAGSLNEGGSKSRQLSVSLAAYSSRQVELGPQQVPEEIADPIVRCRHAAAVARLHEGKVSARTYCLSRQASVIVQFVGVEARWQQRQAADER